MEPQESKETSLSLKGKRYVSGSHVRLKLTLERRIYRKHDESSTEGPLSVKEPATTLDTEETARKLPMLLKGFAAI
jgi:hypothetical protein